jgi:hypothetical protein
MKNVQLYLCGVLMDMLVLILQNELFVCHMVSSNTVIDLFCTCTCIAGSQVEDYQVLGCLSRGCKLC